jgi:thiamine biosynthesis lipoprotein
MALTRRDWLTAATGTLLLPAAAHGLQRTERQLFGSPLELVMPAAAESARTTALRELEAIHRRWNAWKPGDLTALNAAFAAGRSAPVAPALASMIRRATALEAASMGFFNPAIGALVGAWGFHDDDLRAGAKPGRGAIDRQLAARPSLTQIEWRGLEAHSRNPALRLDFGAYAKGVAIDRTFARLRAAGVHDAMLNLGGNLAAMGTVDGRPWRIGIRDPHAPGLAAVVETRGEAVVTSGSYERWRLLDGERCTHILDPLTGEPACGIVSVTVVHASAALADAAATALLVAGADRWPRVAERMGVDQVLVIDRYGRQQATPRLQRRLQRAG